MSCSLSHVGELSRSSHPTLGRHSISHNKSGVKKMKLENEVHEGLIADVEEVHSFWLVQALQFLMFECCFCSWNM